MRLVVILAILARQIDEHIFRPTYIIPDDDQQLRGLLAKLALDASEKESFCRSLLLSIDPENQPELLESRIDSVIRNTASYFSGLLAEDQYDLFRLGLRNIVQRAVDIWTPLQKSQRKYEPDLEPLLWQDELLEPFEFPDEPQQEDQVENGVVPGDNLFMVFPRISVVDSDGRTPHTCAVHVARWQRPCIDAEQELMQGPSSPTIGRMSSTNRARRKSLAPGSPNQPKVNFLGNSVASKA